MRTGATAVFAAITGYAAGIALPATTAGGDFIALGILIAVTSFGLGLLIHGEA